MINVVQIPFNLKSLPWAKLGGWGQAKPSFHCFVPIVHWAAQWGGVLMFVSFLQTGILPHQLDASYSTLICLYKHSSVLPTEA